MPKAMPTPTAAAIPNSANSAVDDTVQRLSSIDSLRAIAMIMVLFFHFASVGKYGWNDLPSRWHNLLGFVWYGSVGVNLFLVLSGFCLYYPYVKQGRRAEPTLWKFAVKRCRRMLPPYYAALALFWLPLLADVLTHHHFHEDATSTPHVVKSLFWHLLMVHNLRPEYVLSIAGPFWSLALEFSLYVCFPLFVEIFRRFGPWLPTAAAFVGELAYRNYLNVQIPSSTLSPEEQFVIYDSLWSRGFEFVVGMAAATVVARNLAGNRSFSSLFDEDTVASPPHPFRNPAASLHNSLFGPWGSLFGFIIVLWGAAEVSCRESLFAPSASPLWGVAFAFLVIAATHPRSPIRRALTHPSFVGLGFFSYSSYLIHFPFVRALNMLAYHFRVPMIPFDIFVAAPSILGLSYLFHLRFEKPFMSTTMHKS